MVIDQALHEGLRFGVAEFGLGLAFELGFPQLDADDRGEALPDVLAAEVGVLVLQNPPVAGELVHQRRQGRPVALFVSAALGGVDRVGEGVDALGESGVPLHRDLRADALVQILSLELDDAGVAGPPLRIQVPYEVADPTGVLVGDLRRLLIVLVAGAFIGQVERQTTVEESHLLESAGQRVEVVDGGLEDLGIGPEDHSGASRLDGFTLGQGGGGRAAPVTLRPHVTVAVDRDLDGAGQGVDHRDADAVQPTGHRVPAATELPTGVQDGQDHLDRRLLLDRVHVDGDAAAVVGDADSPVGSQHHVNRVAETRERLVDGIVHHLIDEVVQPSLTG